MSNKLHLMSRMARFDTVDTDSVAIRGIARPTPVEVVHRKTGVAGYLVETLPAGHSLFHHVVITIDFVV